MRTTNGQNITIDPRLDGRPHPVFGTPLWLPREWLPVADDSRLDEHFSLAQLPSADFGAPGDEDDGGEGGEAPLPRRRRDDREPVGAPR